MEREALNECVQYQQNNGHPDLYATASGVIVSLTHPFLAASPDANVYDPTSSTPFGFAEIKCPFKYRELTPAQAAANSDFMRRREPDGRLCLKDKHIYTSQIQGQMAIGGRNWCDFIVYTSKGIYVQRIKFDRQFWESELLPKLCSFYNLCSQTYTLCYRLFISSLSSCCFHLRRCSKLWSNVHGWYCFRITVPKMPRTNARLTFDVIVSQLQPSYPFRSQDWLFWESIEPYRGILCLGISTHNTAIRHPM